MHMTAQAQAWMARISHLQAREIGREALIFIFME
jgi:hypothetical protein